MTDSDLMVRRAFETAIQLEPTEAVHRYAFADWLDDHDCPEEADFHRQWTLEKHKEAEKWIRDYAKRMTRREAYYTDGLPSYPIADLDDQPVSYEMLMEEAGKRAFGSDPFDGYICLPFDTPDFVHEQGEEFWQHFQTVVGKQVLQERKEYSFIGCSC